MKDGENVRERLFRIERRRQIVALVGNDSKSCRAFDRVDEVGIEIRHTRVALGDALREELEVGFAYARVEPERERLVDLSRDIRDGTTFENGSRYPNLCPFLICTCLLPASD